MTLSAADMSLSQSVYAIRSNLDVKIGVASDVERRLRSLQTGNSEKLRIVKQWRTPYARQIEVEAHKLLAEHRLAGEWFRATDRDVVSAIDALLAKSEYSRRRLSLYVECWSCGHSAIVGTPEGHRSFKCSKCGETTYR